MTARFATLALGFGLGAMIALPTPSWTAEPSEVGTSPASGRREYSVFGAAKESLFGDPYSHPERWQPLSLGTFFTEGWDEAWINPPKGGGGAPRQSWLNAFNGVFYRLVNFPFNWVHDGEADSYTGAINLFTPFSRRFEVQWAIPYIVSSRGADGERHKHFGDFSVTPRFLLSETQDFTQSFNLTFRTPTGDLDNKNGVASITPEYEFWANWWRGFVVRGGAALTAPYNNDGVRKAGARDLPRQPGRGLLLHAARPDAGRRSRRVRLYQPEPADGQPGAQHHDGLLHAGIPYPSGVELVPVRRRRGARHQAGAVRLSGAR